MRFDLPEELTMLRSVVREFADAESAPGASERDERMQFDRSLFHRMGKLGLAGIPLPEQYGGAGSGWLAYAIVLEELARCCASSAASLAAHTVYAAWPIWHSGTDAVRQRLLVPLAAGEMLGGAALPAFRKDSRKQAGLHAVEAGKSKRLAALSGIHPLALNAGAADVYVVFAASRKRANSFAAVFESGHSAVAFGKPIDKLGLRSYATGEMAITGCSVEQDCVLVDHGSGQSSRQLLHTIQTLGQLSAAAISVGIAQGAMEAASAYAKQRSQFGVPIGRHQAILFKLADMSASTDAARLLVHQAAWRLDEELVGERAAAMARIYAADAAVAAAHDAVQIMGGYGYMREFGAERMLRDAKCMETAVGTGGAISHDALRLWTN